ncbi:TIR domain-containing protein [Nostoc sp. UHCC 0702]|nr:TIR domain-containing protein [Nostoc sp. UHCC 0702]
MRDKLETQLRKLKRDNIITDYYDRKIGSEKEWKNQIHADLLTSDIVLLFVSKKLINSGYCSDVELKHAMERHKAQKARVIPIILESVDWKKELFGTLQALPKGNKPVRQWNSRDKAFKNIAEGIREEAKKLTNPTSSNASKNTQTATFSSLGIIVLVGAIWTYSNSQQSNISEPRPTRTILTQTEILNSTGWILIGKINNISGSLSAEEPLIEPFIDSPVIPSIRAVVTLKDEIDLRKEKTPSSQLLQKLQPEDKLVILQVPQIPKSSQNSPSEVWALVRKCNEICQ